jgi:peptidoglycan L-alanyl-D-glutamate endopeptidase CwlK
MARYGRRSMANLEGVHPLLVDWALRLVTTMDNTVVSGVRSLTTQAEYVRLGVSQTMASKHLVQPTDSFGHALDLAPYPVDWTDTRRFYILAGIGIGLASEMNIPIRWGGRWNPDDDQFKLPGFNDMGHFEILTPYNQNIAA